MSRKLVDITMTQNQITYNRLNVTLTRDDVMGKTCLRPDTARNCGIFKAKGLAVKVKARDRRIP
ncbi:arginine--tRNA ligase [Shigella flexneri]